jgi:hypothetical protein
VCIWHGICLNNNQEIQGGWFSVVTAIKSSETLVEGVLDNGLVFIGEYLEKILRHDIIITDHLGKICFPESSDHMLDWDSMFVSISELMKKREFFYCESNGCLYYGVESNHQDAYVIVNNLNADLIPQIINVLRGCRLPIKCYFSKLNKNKDLFASELNEYLFGSSQADIRDILNVYDYDLDVNRLHFALLLRSEETCTKIDPGIIHAYVKEYLMQGKLKIISAYYHDQWVFIIPAKIADDCRINDVDNVFDIIDLKKVIESKFKILSSIGVGQVYTLLDLRKSFNEARIAMILGQLTGQKNFIQKFSDLGIYRPIFSQEVNHIYKYCSHTLGRLIDHDCKNDGELLPTLRKLLDTGGNNKATADQLFIHVNTLYYRINKIEQILNLDLSTMNVRVELYTAIKVWDTLQVLNEKEKIKDIQPLTLAMQA